MTLPLPLVPSLHMVEEAAALGGVDLLAALDEADRDRLRAVSQPLHVPVGGLAFRQGDRHDGIFIIEQGEMRIFHTGPSGREITLAYWSSGNFIGGPDLFGGGLHIWSGIAARPTDLWAVRGADLRRVAEGSPRLALALVDALVHKGQCFSTLIHMLGTRSAAERLAHLLMLIAERDGKRGPGGIVIRRALSHEDLAKMVGSTRQWVSTTLERFRKTGLLEITATRILIRDEDGLRQFAS